MNPARVLCLTLLLLLCGTPSRAAVPDLLLDAVAGEEIELTRTDGTVLRGQLRAFDENAAVLVLTDKSVVAVPRDQVASVALAAPAAPASSGGSPGPTHSADTGRAGYDTGLAGYVARVAAASDTLPDAPTAQQVFLRGARAQGDHLLADVGTIMMEVEVTSRDLKSGTDFASTTRAWTAAPDRYVRVDSQGNVFGACAGVDWRWSEQSGLSVFFNAEQGRSGQRKSFRFPLSLVFDSDYESLELLPRERFEGEEVWVVRAVNERLGTFLLYYSVANGLLIGSTSEWEGRPHGQGIEGTSSGKIKTRAHGELLEDKGLRRFARGSGETQVDSTMVLGGETHQIETRGSSKSHIKQFAVDPSPAPPLCLAEFIVQRCSQEEPGMQAVLSLARRIEALPLPSQDAEAEVLLAELQQKTNGARLCR